MVIQWMKMKPARAIKPIADREYSRTSTMAWPFSDVRGHRKYLNFSGGAN
jgi:hypothetical protein